MRWTSRATQTEHALAVVTQGGAAHALTVRPALQRAALVTAGVGLLTAGAWISAPFYPVPMTMQTLAVLVVGGLLGPKLGFVSVVTYLVLGFSGAPVFHNGLGGVAVLAGPTAGYLVAFVPAVLVMGLSSRRNCRTAGGLPGALRQLGMLMAGAVLAEVAIYAVGLPWLAVVTGLDAEGTVAYGLTPFLLGDLVKMVVAVAVVQGGRRFLGPWRSLPL
jgi:biotin transport system substrate-specific component